MTVRKRSISREQKAQKADRNLRTTRKLALVAIAMFGFGFALVPLYDVFCDITGLNGKTGRAQAESLPAKVDASRWVTVEFTGSVSQGLPWEFRPMQKKLRINPGQLTVASYYVKNTSDETVVGRAVPSVAPGLAAAYFKKIECFCFTEQKLKPGEEREMPVQFVVDPALAATTGTVTLSYTFFNTDQAQARKFGGYGNVPSGEHHDHRAHAVTAIENINELKYIN